MKDTLIKKAMGSTTPVRALSVVGDASFRGGKSSC